MPWAVSLRALGTQAPERLNACARSYEEPDEYFPGLRCFDIDLKILDSKLAENKIIRKPKWQWSGLRFWSNMVSAALSMTMEEEVKTVDTKKATGIHDHVKENT